MFALVPESVDGNVSACATDPGVISSGAIALDCEGIFVDAASGPGLSGGHSDNFVRHGVMTGLLVNCMDGGEAITGGARH